MRNAFLVVDADRNRVTDFDTELEHAIKPDYLFETWARKDSNLQPSGYEPPAPPLSYRPLMELDFTTAHPVAEHKSQVF